MNLTDGQTQSRLLLAPVIYFLVKKERNQIFSDLMENISQKSIRKKTAWLSPNLHSCVATNW